jgi:hypothetical protein
MHFFVLSLPWFKMLYWIEKEKLVGFGWVLYVKALIFMVVHSGPDLIFFFIYICVETPHEHLARKNSSNMLWWAGIKYICMIKGFWRLNDTQHTHPILNSIWKGFKAIQRLMPWPVDFLKKKKKKTNQVSHKNMVPLNTLKWIERLAPTMWTFIQSLNTFKHKTNVRM